eukprot:5773425-Pyramimonas_sp.AAC.1
MALASSTIRLASATVGAPAGRQQHAAADDAPTASVVNQGSGGGEWRGSSIRAIILWCVGRFGNRRGDQSSFRDDAATAIGFLGR